MKTDLANRGASELGRGQSDLKVYFENELAKFADNLPKHIRTDRQVGALLSMLAQKPDIAECDRASILAATVEAMTLGLEISPRLGESWFIARWNGKTNKKELNFQIGYAGLIKLVRQYGGVASIQSRIVHKEDEFVYEYTPDLNFLHKPILGKRRTGGKEGVYAVYCHAKLPNGEPLVEVMTVDQVEEIRARSKNANAGPWVTDWQEMAKKTVLRRLIKILPKSPELTAALEVHDREYDFDSRPQIDNQTGFGHGKYASPEQTQEYLAKMEGYLDERNQMWLDRWTRDGEIPEGVKDLCNRWQADKHLLKWAVETGRLDPNIDAEGLKNAQIGRFTGIVYHRGKEDRAALTRELRKYVDEIEARQAEALRLKHPELFEPEDFGDEPEDDFIEAEVAKPEEPAPPPSPSAGGGDRKKGGPKAATSLFTPLPREPGSDD